MRKILSRHLLTAGGLIITALLATIANFALHLPNNDQFIILAIGLMTTLVIAAVEREVPQLFATQLDQKLEIYKLLSQIEDQEFAKWAHEIIADAEYKLRLLARGEFRSRMGSGYERVRLHRAKKSLRAVYLGMTFQALGFHSWTSRPDELRYYDENLKALKRRVKIIRIFLLQKSKTIDESKGTVIDTEIANIMQTQETANIEVRIAWVEEIVTLGSDLLKDFVILDTFEVDAREYFPDGNWEGVIWRNSSKLQEYERIFDTLYEHSLPFALFLASKGQSPAGPPGIMGN